jgi:hypothetical protein
MNLSHADLVDVGNGQRIVITPELLRGIANDADPLDDFLVRILLRRCAEVLTAMEETIASTRRVNQVLYDRVKKLESCSTE